MWPFRKPETRSIEGWPWDTGSSRGGPADRSIGVERALHLVPVFGAARLLGDTVASLTPNLFTMASNGIARKQTQPSLFAQPSLHGTLYDWLFRATVSMALQGDAIGLVTERNYYGFPTMIEWLNPEAVSCDDGTLPASRDKLAGQGSYMNPIWWWHGRRVNPEDIIHIPWFTQPYRVRGMSPIGAFRLTCAVGLGAEEYAAQWFNNGGVPPGTFRNTQQKVSKEDADLIEARITGRLNRRRPLVYGADWEYTPIAITPNEARFVETAQLTATQIAVIYGVPPEKIGGTTGDSFTYANVENSTIDYLTFSARPWLVRLEQALSRLFPRGTFVKFDTSDFIRTDAKTRAEIDSISLGWQNAGWRSQNEVRADRDMEPLPKSEIPQPVTPTPTALPARPPTNGAAPPTSNGTKPAMAPK